MRGSCRLPLKDGNFAFDGGQIPADLREVRRCGLQRSHFALDGGQIPADLAKVGGGLLERSDLALDRTESRGMRIDLALQRRQIFDARVDLIDRGGAGVGVGEDRRKSHDLARAPYVEAAQAALTDVVEGRKSVHGACVDAGLRKSTKIDADVKARCSRSAAEWIVAHAGQVWVRPTAPTVRAMLTKTCGRTVEI